MLELIMIWVKSADSVVILWGRPMDLNLPYRKKCIVIRIHLGQYPSTYTLTR